jgi:hypothetical protein
MPYPMSNILIYIELSIHIALKEEMLAMFSASFWHESG